MIGDSSLDAIFTLPFAYCLFGGLCDFIQALCRVFKVVWSHWLYRHHLYYSLGPSYHASCCHFGMGSNLEIQGEELANLISRCEFQAFVKDPNL